jgi:HD-GYP domain-containing protein (c-di-GMP phosphodiesterase class II)
LRGEGADSELTRRSLGMETAGNMSERGRDSFQHGIATRVLVLLAGRDERDATTREAVSRAGVPVSFCVEPGEVESRLEPSISLVILDAEAPDGAADRVAGVIATVGSNAQVLALLPSGAAPADIFAVDVTPHYLTRPFAAETLTALCLHLLSSDVPETGVSKGVAAEPAGVQARSPRSLTPNRLYEQAVVFASSVLDAVREDRQPDVPSGRTLAEEIHTDLLHGNGLVNRSLEPHETYDLASHCVNVAIIAGKIAMGMALGVEDVVRVVHAGLIHDLGMARLPESILRKRTPLSEEELARLREHPVHGADILEDLGPRYEWLQRAVLQEHERARGQGYPGGLVGQQIDPVAQILGVADVFEALSHPRVYRSPYTGLEALETVAGMQEEYLQPRIVAALVNEISAFPLDSYVQLSTGEIAQVVATNPVNLLRPTVEVRWNAEWTPIAGSTRLDLAEFPDVTIARALLDAELPLT